MYHSFYGLEFAVTPQVLQPYGTTERIVDRAIRSLKKGQTFCDVGTGSGNIAVAILKNTNTKGIGLDTAPEILDVARLNAVVHRVANRLDLRKSDGLGALSKPVDLIVCNAPYLPKDRALRAFGPLNALTDGLDGLTLIKQLVQSSPKLLLKGGILLLEYVGQQNITAIFDSSWAIEQFREGVEAKRI